MHPILCDDAVAYALDPITVLDVDGTLADTVPPALVAVNAVFGTDYRPDDMETYGLCDFVRAQAEKRFLRVLLDSPEFNANLAPLPAGIAAAKALYAHGRRVWVVTERPPELEEVTRRWLGEQGVRYERLIVGGKGCKAAVLEALADRVALTFVDDHPEKDTELAHPNATVFLLEYSFTRNIRRATVVPPHDWTPILAHLGVPSTAPVASPAYATAA